MFADYYVIKNLQNLRISSNGERKSLARRDDREL